MANWSLTPSIARAPHSLDHEMPIFKRFRQNASPFVQSPPKDEWEWLLLLQHFGAPTRLLDWTESPLVGLYFAVENAQHDHVDGCLWCLWPVALNKFSRITLTHDADIPCFGVDEEIDTYLPTQIHGTRTKVDNYPIAVLAPRQFGRIYAQFGVFTITHRTQTDLRQVEDGSHLAQFAIPAASKAKLRAELDLLRVNKLSIFPELTNVAAEATRIFAT